MNFDAKGQVNHAQLFSLRIICLFLVLAGCASTRGQRSDLQRAGGYAASIPLTGAAYTVDGIVFIPGLLLLTTIDCPFMFLPQRGIETQHICLPDHLSVREHFIKQYPWLGRKVWLLTRGWRK